MSDGPFSVLLIAAATADALPLQFPASTPTRHVVRVATGRDAHACLESGFPADLIVWFSLRPGDLKQHELDRLHGVRPLCPLLVVAGPWCEGETRTGEPITGVHRIYWHQWNSQCQAELARVEAGERSVWNAPRTASLADRLFDVGFTRGFRDSQREWGWQMSPTTDRPSPPQVVILAETRTDFEAIRGVCDAIGLASGWARTPDEGVNARSLAGAHLVWNCGDWRAHGLLWLTWLRQQDWDGGVILVDFPRPHEVQQIERAGFRCLGRPFLVDDLIAALHVSRAKAM